MNIMVVNLSQWKTHYEESTLILESLDSKKQLDVKSRVTVAT